MAEQKTVEEIKLTKEEKSLAQAMAICERALPQGCYLCKFGAACEELWDWFCSMKPADQFFKVKFFRSVIFHFRDVRKGLR